MGEYEPDDSRDVTLRPGHEPGGIKRTGPREGETRQQDQSDKRDNTARMGYGNARNEDGTSEQAEADSDLENSLNSDVYDAAQPGETSDNEAERARADANRPLNGS